MWMWIIDMRARSLRHHTERWYVNESYRSGNAAHERIRRDSCSVLRSKCEAQGAPGTARGDMPLSWSLRRPAGDPFVGRVEFTNRAARRMRLSGFAFGVNEAIEEPFDTPMACR